MANVYQVSDLATKRTQFVAEARDGLARLRDKDGKSLVMFPEDRLDYLERIAELTTLLIRLDVLCTSAASRDIHALGELAWLRSLDSDDLQEFAGELREALVVAQSERSTAAVDEMVEAWHMTARQLDDPLRRSILTGTFDLQADFQEVQPPEPPSPAAAEDPAAADAI